MPIELIQVRARRWFLGGALAVLAAGLGSHAALANDENESREPHAMHWVTAWGISQQPNTVPVVLSNATVRLVARVSIPGEAIRIRLDNTFSTNPLVVGAATVGPRQRLALLAVSELRTVTFNGNRSVTVPAGGSVLSDAVALRVDSQQDLGVNLYLPGNNVSASQHAGAVTTSYRSADGSGNLTADANATAFGITFTAMPWLKAIDVLTVRSVTSVVAFGDSITDGTCNTLDANDRWHNVLSVRMDTEPLGASDVARSTRDRYANKFAFVNEGIGGNTVTRAGLSPPPDSTPGMERLERDVLSHSGVSHVVLFMGTNDIRREATAAGVIAGLRDIAARLEVRGIKVFAATIIPRHNVTPVGTNTGWNDAKTAIRNEVNRWMRTPRTFDAVLDFDRVVHNPDQADLINPPYNCGDGIHPSPIGYYQMGKSVDLNLFKVPRGRR
jgi:lysophospholipase L1-like esterase